MMISRRAVFLFAAALVGVGAALAVAGAGVLADPAPLFDYSTRYGRLELRSDQPFDADAGRRVLADVEGRLGKSEFNDDGPHQAIVANTELRRRITFLWNGGAAGLNYYPLSRSVFIRGSDIGADRVYGASGKAAKPPRTLAYYITHEIGHTLAKERVGVAANASAPRWIREGVADYIGFGSQADVDEMIAALRNHDPSFDPRSGYYMRYRLLIAGLIQRKQWTLERLLLSDMSQEEAEKIVLGSAS